MPMKRSDGLQAIIDARQAEMNRPENRALSDRLLSALAPLSEDDALGLCQWAVRAGYGVAYELTALRILKPWAPWGQEIEA